MGRRRRAARRARRIPCPAGAGGGVNTIGSGPVESLPLSQPATRAPPAPARKRSSSVASTHAPRSRVFPKADRPRDRVYTARHSSARARQSPPKRSSTMRGLRVPGGSVLRIAVLFGGDSMERDVSIASASQVVGALRSRGHEVISVDSGRGRLSAPDEQRLFAGRIDRLPPEQSAVREPADRRLGAGSRGRRPRVPRAARRQRRGRHGSGVARPRGHPVHRQRPARQRTSVGTRTSRSGCFSRPACRRRIGSWRRRRPTSSSIGIGFPLIVKPNGQGSTVGLTLVKSEERARRRAQVRRELRQRRDDRALRPGPRAHGRHPRGPRARGRGDHPEDRADLRLRREVPGRAARKRFSPPTSRPSRPRARRISRCACIAR